MRWRKQLSKVMTPSPLDRISSSVGYCCCSRWRRCQRASGLWSTFSTWTSLTLHCNQKKGIISAISWEGSWEGGGDFIGTNVKARCWNGSSKPQEFLQNNSFTILIVKVIKNDRQSLCVKKLKHFNDYPQLQNAGKRKSCWSRAEI